MTPNNKLKTGLKLLVPAGLALVLMACGGSDKNTTNDRSAAGPDTAPAAIATSGQTSIGNTSGSATPPTSATGTVRLNLNTANGTEFQNAIPNFPPRMVGEFTEYRPYVSIQQFRKEIGKYVGTAQVTEWEKYVFVPVDPNNSDNETLKQLPGVTDANVGQLTAARPYTSNDAFLTKLASVTSPANAAAAKAMLKS